MEWPAHPPLVGGGGVSFWLYTYLMGIIVGFCDFLLK